MACVSALTSLVEISESDRTHRGMAFFFREEPTSLVRRTIEGRSHTSAIEITVLLFFLFFFGLLLDIN